MSDPHPDMGKWLGSHHRVVKGKKGGEIHVFATKQGKVYASDDSTETYSISFGFGPVTITIVITIDTDNNTISICVYASIPFFPDIKLGCVSGTIDDDGLTITFDTWIISGSFTFYVKDGALWLHYDVTVFGTEYEGDIELFELP